jgi:hypothetical protein
MRGVNTWADTRQKDVQACNSTRKSLTQGSFTLIKVLPYQGNYLIVPAQTLTACRLFLPRKPISHPCLPPMRSGTGFTTYDIYYKKQEHPKNFQLSVFSMFSGLKKKLSRRSSNPLAGTNAVYGAKSVGSQNSGLAPPAAGSPFSLGSPATRRPSKHCRQPLCLRRTSANVAHTK